MLETKMKELVRTRIEDALKAIETLRDIAEEARKAEDFLTLGLIADGNIDADSHSLKRIMIYAQDSLDYYIHEPAAETARKWYEWADSEFPDTEPFSYLAKELAEEA